MSSHWEPILIGDEAVQVRSVARDIVRELLERTMSSGPDARDIGLFDGRPGLALLWKAICEDDEFRESLGLDAAYAAESLARSIDEVAATLSEQPTHPWLYGGLAGLGWLLNYLADVADSGVQNLLEQIDQAYSKGVEVDGSAHTPYEFFRGLAGVALYLLERPSSPAVIVALETIADKVAASAVHTDAGASWFTPPESLPLTERENAPSGYYNLGTAHGIPGLVAVLARVRARNIGAARLDTVLNPAVRWMFGHRDQTADLMQFPAAVGFDGRRYSTSISWCYGDLGIAATLFMAARTIGHQEWEADALDMARRLALLPISTGTARREAILCHGSVGIAHIFARFYNETSEAVFREAARRWLLRTLEVRQGGRFIGGYGTWTDERGWHERRGFLDGSVGIVLGLLAATTTVDPSWDRLLLLSGDPVSSASVRVGASAGSASSAHS